MVFLKQIDDGHCDYACLSLNCNWDGNDCNEYTGVCDFHLWTDSCMFSMVASIQIGNGVCNPQCDTTKCGFDNYECEGSPHTHPYYADDSFNWTPGFKAAEVLAWQQKQKQK